MSIESLEEALGIKFERQPGELLPPIRLTKKQRENAPFDVEWVKLEEMEPQ